MVASIVPSAVPSSMGPAGEGKGAGGASPERSEIGKRFEQVLWAEMLSHAGLEKSLTLGGGEAASAFSRYVVESIAADLAETHPLGLARKVDDLTAGNGATQVGQKGAPE